MKTSEPESPGDDTGELQDLLNRAAAADEVLDLGNRQLHVTEPVVMDGPGLVFDDGVEPSGTIRYEADGSVTRVPASEL